MGTNERRPLPHASPPDCTVSDLPSSMPIHVVRLGAPRAPGQGVRLGTVRRPPRGVPKADCAKLDYFDVWLPELAPGAPLVSWALAEPWTDTRWRRYVRSYLSEMKAPSARHLIATLAALSSTTTFSVGCYCKNKDRCHRTVLAELLREAGADVSFQE